MTLEKKVARLIYPEFRFGKMSLKDGLDLVKMGVGGFCLYGGSLNEVVETIRALRNASKTPLIFAADYENGVGQWVKEATLLPTNMAIGASQKSELARRKAEITAIEADAIGVDWVFAPVVDLATNHSNPIVNLRAFSDSPSKVQDFASNYISGLDSFNIISCIKHFPGHGDTSCDSHITLPEIKKTKDELRNLELKPFKALINRADSVMVGHLKINSLDEYNITSFSKKTITDLLIKELGFSGVVITDALSMKAISDESYAGVNAFLAGAHILLVPENPYKLYSALIKVVEEEKINENLIDKAISMQDLLIRKRAFSKKNTRDISVVGSSYHKSFNIECAPYCITWIKGKKEGFLKDFKKIYYFEPLKTESDWRGETFVKSLKSYGINFTQNIDEAELIIIGSFLEPRAYSGKINLNIEEKYEIDKILKHKKKYLLISFGSPFIFDEYYEKVESGICTFGAIKEFQEILARGLLGKVNLSGTLPVELSILNNSK